VTWLLPMVQSDYSCMTLALSTWQLPNVLLHTCKALTTKANPGADNCNILTRWVDSDFHTCLWEDNVACVLVSENPVDCYCSCHGEVKSHFLRERVCDGCIKLYKCWGSLNVADALIKSLHRPAFP